MVGETALSVFLSPVGAMLAGAAASGIYALRAWRSVSQTIQADALAGLFQRDVLADQLSARSLRHLRARGQQRTARDRHTIELHQREAMLNQMAAVMRGGERDGDGDSVRAATRYLAGEGFVQMENVAHARSSGLTEEIVEIEEFEEVKLLPRPRSRSRPRPRSRPRSLPRSRPHPRPLRQLDRRDLG